MLVESGMMSGSLMALCEAMAVNRSVRSLDLSSNKLGAGCPAALRDMLAGKGEDRKAVGAVHLCWQVVI